MARIKPIDHEDELTLVGHLDELRARLIVCVAVFVVAVAFCFLENHLILDLLNAPIPGDRKPITLGVSEPFMTTLTVSAYAGILLALPIVLYELYAFILPVFSREQRKVAIPILCMVPVLFIAGVVFAYVVVLPAAIKFLLNFNQSQYDIQIRARDYYSFVAMTLASLGILFQIPVGVLALTKLGVTTPQKLRGARKQAVVAIAVLAMLLPGTDPITMLISMVPLIALYEFSILLAVALGKPSKAVDGASAA